MLPKKTCFIHPDLGIGGAERLIVDAALSLQSDPESFDVHIYTSHCDRSHCFEEIKTNELKVTVIGDFLPVSFLGKFKIFFAILRQVYLCIYLILTGEFFKYDIVILDQLSFGIPLLHLFKSSETIVAFYIHFPDLLLASHHTLLKRIYRFAFDFCEELSTSYADLLFVNSSFTKSVVQRTFKSLASRELHVLYPCIAENSLSTDEFIIPPLPLDTAQFFLSINRFERKKNIELAIESFSLYKLSNPTTERKLVLAGGYDKRISENVEYLNELEAKADKLNLKHCTIHNTTQLKSLMADERFQESDLIFLPSISTDVKNALLSSTLLLMYTPSFEHFGIVPIEAMSKGKLVLACNSGGPLETIANYPVENYTGFTVEPSPQKWCDTLVLVDTLDLGSSSSDCVGRVDELFSFKSFTLKFVSLLTSSKPLVYRSEVFLRYFALSLLILLISLCNPFKSVSIIN